LKNPTSKGPGRPRGQQSEDKQKLILDEAEKLFAGSGFHAVTLRQVASAAGVDTALLHYYFKHKRGLFDQVFQRRADVLNAARLEELNRYESSLGGEKPSVRGAINAFITPLIEKSLSQDPGWRSFFGIVAMINNTPEIGGEIMSSNFDPVVLRLLTLIEKAQPDVPRDQLFWAYHCLSGGITLTMSQSGRLSRLSGNLCDSNDMKKAFEHLIDFATAGFMTLPSTHKA
jgi:AcrR family transcriptional regulator